MSKTHWKKLHNPDYLGAYAFQPNEEKIATIREAKVDQVTGSGGKREDCMVVYFTDHNLKPLIANVTNSKAIAKVAGSDYIEDWAGVSITLYTTEVQAFGDTVQAVRVRSKAPKLTKPELTPTHEKWESAKQNIAEGKTTMQAILKHYNVSKEHQEQMATEINNA